VWSGTDDENTDVGPHDGTLKGKHLWVIKEKSSHKWIRVVSQSLPSTDRSAEQRDHRV